MAAHERHLLDRPDGPLEWFSDGKGPAIVLVASLGRGAEDFDGIVPLLTAAGHRVIRMEPRGIGASAPLRAEATMHDIAADLAAVLEAAGESRVIVAGHAAGNWPARMLAHDHTSLVQGVAMLAAVTGTGARAEIAAAINGSFDPALTDAERLRNLQVAYFAPGHDASVWLPGWFPEVAAAQRRANANTTDREWLRAAERVPLLYLAAAEDAIAPPPTLEELREALGPQVTRVVVPDAGHALLPEQPRAVADALVTFARAVWG
ncbi:alpha/beta fold hydrolase [Roseomonas sp. CCTCC AB2023176]|uniref:alpha/beta fold hydrolase n=1 Tax=Roseomonas sp. CCTCC AB2023176 TaxID=3342640 RepID=UPI0035DF9E4C